MSANAEQSRFSKGSLLGPYEIASSIGAGGMGEVFRARDTRLNRDVAVKVLPKDFAADADRLRRFEQEAKTLAALNHPNVLTIHDAGVHESAPYIVSELLEGRTLREELNTGALPVRKATDYALQIAHGLAAAHGKGVIHRDLKPENLFVTRDGRVKILDFGLGKIREMANAECRMSNEGRLAFDIRHSTFDSGASTVVQKRDDSTVPGLILGTPAYMAPEQVRGEAADPRTDIFAFGCVLYEMLSGALAFRRDTAVASMNAVLSEEPPDLSTTKATVPPALERVLRRCLEKQADNRFQSAKDLAFAIEVASDRTQKPSQGTTASSEARTRKLLWAGISLSVLAFAGGFIANKMAFPSRTAAAPSIRYLTFSGRDYSPAASVDGKRVCFASDRDGTKRIWIKEIASGVEAPLTSGPDDFPRFSRDGSSILFTRAFGSKRALLRIPSIPGEPYKIVEDALSGDWSPDGRYITIAMWEQFFSIMETKDLPSP